MSVKEIKSKLVELTPDERNEVSAFLFHLQQFADPEYQKLLEARMNDKDPSHWLTLEQLEERLGPDLE